MSALRLTDRLTYICMYEYKNIIGGGFIRSRTYIDRSSSSHAAMAKGSSRYNVAVQNQYFYLCKIQFLLNVYYPKPLVENFDKSYIYAHFCNPPVEYMYVISPQLVYNIIKSNAAAACTKTCVQPTYCYYYYYHCRLCVACNLDFNNRRGQLCSSYTQLL